MQSFIFDHVAVAFFRLHDRESIQSQLDNSYAKLEAINCIGELIGHLDLEVLLAKLMEISLFISSAQVGSVILSEDNRLVSRVEWGLNLENALKLRFADGEAILDRTIKTAEPQLVSHYQDRRLYLPVLGIDVQACMCIPLVSKGKVLGAVFLINSASDDGRFSKTDQDSILTITGLAATAIENAILYKVSLDRERIQASLKIAQSIQQGMYPKEPPRVPGYRIAWINSSCDETGGDYFDFISSPASELFITIGDVSGHGIGAAMLMATGRANLRALCSVKKDVGDIVVSLNSLLEHDLDDDNFMTFFLARLTLADHCLEFVNAGHDTPLLYSAADKDVSDLDSTGFPLGLFPGAEYDLLKAGPMGIGDILLLTTDGVWEVNNAAKVRYGKDRLRETFKRHAALDPEQLVNAIHDEVKEYVTGSKFHDDLTMVAIKRVG
jgi:serine phosphatase RsbU (regulator of sigma subunit)